MKHDKQQAFELRRSGMSYKAISRELGIPIGTLSGWFKKEPWSEDIKIELIQRQASSSLEHMEKMRLANVNRFESLRQRYRDEAVKEFKILKKNPLFLAGLMLYWGEGERSRKSSVVRLANSDPEMIRIFYLFLKSSVKISEDRICAWLLLYPDLVDTVQKNFWSKTTGLSLDKFKKSIYVKGRHPTKRLAYGVCTIFVQSRGLKERMLKWIDMAINHLRTSP